MTTVSGHIGLEHFKTVLTNNRHHLIADEPAGSGGTDLGFSPSELLCSALATCTCVTLRMYADKKQWPLTKVQADINFTADAVKGSSHFKREIRLSGDLTAEQQKRLLQIADQCFIHKTLTGPITVESNLA